MRLAVLLLAQTLLLGSATAAVLGGRVELTPVKTWKEVSAGDSEFSTAKFIPLDDRNAALSVSVFPPELKITDLLSLRRFHRGACKSLMSSPDAPLDTAEFQTADGTGVYATFEDPDLVGKPIQKGNCKFATVLTVWLRPETVLQITLLTDAKTGPDFEEGLAIARSAKLVAAGGPPRAAAPPANAAGAGAVKPITIAGVDAVLTLPAGFEATGAARPKDGYFSFSHDSGVMLSGWLDHAQRYSDFKAFWAREKASLEKGMGSRVRDEKFLQLEGWDVVAYTTETRGLQQNHLRACRVEGKTWADLHLSTVVMNGRGADLEDALKRVGFAKP